MKNIILDSNEIENIEDCIPSIEEIYKFKFEKGETEKLKNFEELCDLIITKIKLENIESCTTQQAFYKLRKSLIEEKIKEKEKIKLDVKLTELFPRKNRIELVRKVENNIGFELNILFAPKFILNSLVILCLISIVLVFINFKIGVLGIGVSIFGFYMCKLYGKELEIETFKQLIEKVTKDNYLKVRTKTNTVNKIELKNLLSDWFAENTGIRKEKLINSTFA